MMEELDEALEEEWSRLPATNRLQSNTRSYAFTAASTLLIAAYANRSLTGAHANLNISRQRMHGSHMQNVQVLRHNQVTPRNTQS